MPLLTVVSKKTPQAKALIAFFYLMLTIGGITMVYPFLLMISGSMKGNFDLKEMNVIPKYFLSETALYRSYCESKYAVINNYNQANETGFTVFDDVMVKTSQPALAAEFTVFTEANPVPTIERILGHYQVDKNAAKHRTAFIQYLGAQFDKDIEEMNAALGTNFIGWDKINLDQGTINRRKTLKIENVMYDQLLSYRKLAPEIDFYEPTADALFRDTLIYSRFGTALDALSDTFGTKIANHAQLSLSQPATFGNLEFKEMKKNFLKRFLNPRLIDLKPTPKLHVLYQDFLKLSFKSSIVALKTVYPEASNFSDIQCPSHIPSATKQALIYSSFLGGPCPTEEFIVNDTQTRFRQHLLTKHKDLASINTAYSLSLNHLSELSIPRSTIDLLHIQNNPGSVKWNLATRNFKFVANYLVSQGRAAFVTVVFCVLSIVTALIVNPLAAYALSRYGLPSTYKILLFLMATMAFPHAVTQIPSFLLLKELNLLNTFWALILPGIAHGYSIFILKGFFDSLPTELYEAASLDGASEMKMFMVITMNLSKPVLALIALNSFTAAYGAFMFALLICQDERMWTIMVYLYQLQSVSSQSVIYASLLLAAIPTLLIFISCQNVIMRGIVVPSEK